MSLDLYMEFDSGYYIFALVFFLNKATFISLDEFVLISSRICITYLISEKCFFLIRRLFNKMILFR